MQFFYFLTKRYKCQNLALCQYKYAEYLLPFLLLLAFYHPLVFHLKFQKQFGNEDNLICSLKMSLTIDQGHIYSSANIIFNSTH